MNNPEENSPQESQEAPVRPAMEMDSKRNLAITAAVGIGALAVGAKLLGSEVQAAQAPQIENLNTGTVSEQTVDGAQLPAPTVSNEVATVPRSVTNPETPVVAVDVKEPKTDEEIRAMARDEVMRNPMQWGGGLEEAIGYFRHLYPAAPSGSVDAPEKLGE